jgi:hypothetical protein
MKAAPSLWKKLRVLLLMGLALFIAIQFIRPPLDHPPVRADLNAPPEVKAIFRRACYDCHSNETRLAWFDLPAPAYWMVVKDVNEGRKALNFSNFDSLPGGVQAAKYFECIMQMEQHAMPLNSYTFLHHGGRISAAELDRLKRYAATLAYMPKPDTTRRRMREEQYAQWIAGAGTGVRVQEEYNGVPYGPLAGFADWKAVSTTERYDNGTFRLILGNEVTVKAIREGHTHPWPDGAIFAKVAWDQLPDSSGEIGAGAFKQVEFMIRDSRKYASTFGWGWARWVGGLGMKPYGKNAAFVTECMNCHRPVARFDYTFTLPLADTLSLYDRAPSLPDSVASHPLAGKVITTMVDPRSGTMSTLYGNDPAVKSARHGRPYAPGAIVTLVTWSQREDPHWFGGRIPKGLASVESVSIDPSGAPLYERYEGMPLTKKMPAATTVAARVQYITGKKASVLPTP